MCPIVPLSNHTLHGGCVCTGNVWQQHEDTSSGHAFYYCAATGETRWTPPEGDELLLDAMTGKVVGGGKLLSGEDAEAAKTAAATAGTSTARGTRPPTHRRSSITLTAHNVSNHSHASFVVVVVVGVPRGSPRVLLCVHRYGTKSLTWIHCACIGTTMSRERPPGTAQRYCACAMQHSCTATLCCHGGLNSVQSRVRVCVSVCSGAR